jgi:Mn2+/Fe2+ NRAMP family transporter
MVALLVFTSSSRVMGPFRNKRAIVAIAAAMTALIVALNGVLLWHMCAG